ncbi:MAG TPA: hypothetical protein VFZ21_14055, partial [Gemmatimonadaceae bacterium]|nr:hypothetical protein [Gemmatimonadaceae bacterium]
MMTRLWLRVIPTRRLAYAVAVCGLLWLLPGRLGVWAGIGGLGVLTILTLLDWAILPNTRGVIVERELPASVGIGDRVEGRYTVRSAWSRPLHVQLVDELPPAVQGGAGVVAIALPAHGTADVPFDAAGRVRGRAALGRVGVQSS